MANNNDELSRTGNRNMISSQTLMPLGAVIAIVLALWRGSAMLDDRFSQLAASDRTIAEQLTLIKYSLNDRWSAVDQRLWTQNLQIKNPTLVVPEVVSSARRLPNTDSRVTSE